MIAAPIPRSLNMLKKKVITVTTATIPNLSGDINLASTPVIINDMRIPEYLAMAV